MYFKMDSENFCKKDLRDDTKYKKHGRDTPQGRAKYSAEHKKVTYVKSPTAESEKPWKIEISDTRHRNAVQQAIYTTPNGEKIWDTVQKCQLCNKWTSRVDFCDVCSKIK